MRAKRTLDEIKNEFRLVWGDTYNYDLITEDNYQNSATKVPIVCKEHGIFFVSPSNHIIRKVGCQVCSREKLSKKYRHTTEQFIKKAKEKYGDLYGYEKVVYERANKKVIITCAIHGDFLQTPNNHINGKGCPKCKKSFGENKIGDFLTKNGIKYVPQYSIHNENIFCKNKVIKVDFYLETYNTIIEYNGQQHYKEEPYFCSRSLEEQQIRDMSLRQYCKEHKIKLIEIPYWEFDNIEDIINKELRL